MKFFDVKKNKQPRGGYTAKVNVRVTKHQLKWIKDHNLSISRIFRVALKELGYQEEKTK